MSFVAQALQQLGYIGATGSTPYTASTAAQVATLQTQYNAALSGQTIVRSSAIQLTLNFDGTQNNREYVAEGEFQTNVATLADLSGEGINPNSFYFSGIGAQTVPSGTLLPDGNIDPRSYPSDWESIPWQAGENGNQIIKRAYQELIERVSVILAENPNAEISLNLTGFSRGGAQAVAFANHVNEHGIPGLYPAGQVPINSMVLFDPVSQTSGVLNVTWPGNLVNPALVLVATAENRVWFPAMPVGANSIIVPIEGVHSNIGGSFNPDGISAVTLKIAHDYLAAAGVPLSTIPADVQPDWGKMHIHNSAIDSHGNERMPAIGEPTVTVGSNRYYEGTGLGSITVKDALRRDVHISPIYQTVNGRLSLIGFNARASSVVTDEITGARTETADITLYARDGKTVQRRNFTSTTTDSTGRLTDRLIVTYEKDGVTIRSTSLTERLPNNNELTTNRDRLGNTINTVEQQRFDDGTALQTTTYPSGRVEVLSTDTSGQPASRTDTIPGSNTLSGNTEVVNRYTYEDGQAVQQSSTAIQYFHDDDGVSRIEEVTSFIGGQPRTVRTAYDTDNLPGTPVDITASNTPSFMGQVGDALTQSAGLVNLVQAIQSGNDTAMASSGLNLINDLANPIVQLPGGGVGYQFPVLNAAAQVAGGVASFYNLANAIQNGDAFNQTYASLSTVNYLNITLTRSVNEAGQLVFASNTASASLSTFLNGTGEGLLAGGTAGVGVLGWVGLINGLKSGDPISMIQGLGPLIWGQAFTPWGVGIAVLSLLFAKDPEAWGVANVTYGEGFNNLSLKVHASGEEFGPERVRGQLEGLIGGIQGQLDQINVGQPEDQQLGLIAQRMPGLSWRASDLDNMGYELVDIDPLTGAQRYPYRRFDDDGIPFSSDSALYQVDPTDPEQRVRMDEALLQAALRRGAIAPLWEVKTAKLQAEGGQADAGLSEEERASKAGYAAALDTAFAAANPLSEEAKTKRIGHFMPVALDVDGDGLVSTTALGASQVGFNWDGLNFKKNTGWVSANDAFLVLDRDFNQSVDSGAELLSNPLVADPAKGLRSLATWDANGDGKIDRYDPIYHQLKVWQDFNQDGDNTQTVTIDTAAGPQTVTVQDEASVDGRNTLELNSLADWGITAIDYANNRYEFDSGLRNDGVANGQVGYRNIKTVTLDASDEGVRYTPVGAGIRIDDTSGSSEIVITQVQSDGVSLPPVNSPPGLAQQIADVQMDEDTTLVWSVPADAFTDINTSDSLNYTVSLANGQQLPAWLTFDPVSRQLTAQPGNAQVGTVALRVIAADRSGATAGDVFEITVRNVNDAPVVTGQVGQPTATATQAFSYVLPADLFADVDAGDELTIGVRSTNGQALPDWLSFDAATRTLSGTPPMEAQGLQGFTVVATDLSGATASVALNVNVADAPPAPNSAPVLAQQPNSQVAQEDEAFIYRLPAGTFTDVDAVRGDTLRYAARLANGSPLPDWLQFDAATRTFSGIPGNAQVGALAVVITATDNEGASAQASLALSVANVNDAPVVSAVLGNAEALEAQSFSYVLPAQLFTDVDADDPLAWSANLANGNPLPSWLTFNADTRTLSGTPPLGQPGLLDLSLTATDLAGATAQTQLLIDVRPAPLLVAGETIGSASAPLWEDGSFQEWNPNTQGFIRQTLLAHGDPANGVGGLLDNDSWGGLTGQAAGLTIDAVDFAGSTGLRSLSLTAEGNISYELAANFNGIGGFDYTVRNALGETQTARVTLNVTAVNDKATVAVQLDQKSIYGWGVLTTITTWGNVENGGYLIAAEKDKGLPIDAPYYTVVGRRKVGEQNIGWGEDSNVVPIWGAYEDTEIPKSYFDDQYSRMGYRGEHGEYYPPSAVELSLDGVQFRIDANPGLVYKNTVLETIAWNDGYVSAVDEDGSGQFTYSIAQDGLYGKAEIDPNTGRFVYTGNRFVEHDVRGTEMNGNFETDDAARYEQRFTDVFKVKVTDARGNETYQDVSVTHFGPPPNPNVSNSGGKKPIAIDMDGDGFHFTDVDDSNVFRTYAEPMIFPHDGIMSAAY